MTVNKRKRLIRLRGSRTHGWGTKKHRGAGNRGGRGMAGTGKRADQKKPTIIKTVGYKEYFGRHGFKRPQKLTNEIKIINVGDLKSASKEINLRSLGYEKLLGKGKVTKSYEVIIDSYSELAKKKLEKAGGSVKKE